MLQINIVTVSLFRSGVSNTRPARTFCAARDAFWKFSYNSIFTLPSALKKCREMIEPVLDDTQCGFRPDRSTTDDISLSSKFLRNVGSMTKTSAYALSTSRKPNTGFFVKSLLREYGVDGRLLLTVKSLSGCSEISVQSPLHELDLRLRCQRAKQSQPSRRGCYSWKLQDQPFTFCSRFDTASIFSTEYSACTRSVFCCVRPSQNETKH